MLQELGPQLEWTRAILTRDVLFSCLLEELEINKILLENLVYQKPNNKSTNSGSSPDPDNIPSQNFQEKKKQKQHTGKWLNWNVERIHQ